MAVNYINVQDVNTFLPYLTCHEMQLLGNSTILSRIWDQQDNSCWYQYVCIGSLLTIYITFWI